MFVYLFNSKLKSNYYTFPIAYASFCFVEAIKVYIASDFYYEHQFRALETLMAGARQIISPATLPFEDKSATRLLAGVLRKHATGWEV